MTVLTANRSRLADRVGIIARLLAGSLLALLIAVASVQFWTLRAVEANGIQRAQASLETSMAMLRHELAPLGAVWSKTADGKLLLGATVLNGRNDLVDAVRDVTGAATTIFLGDMRIATNVKNPDGSRGIGTRLAPGPAYDMVQRDGRTYHGPATILGTPHLTIYEPIKDGLGQSIGILFVGVSLADAQFFMQRITRDAAGGALAIALLAGIAYLWALRATVRPLTLLAGVMHKIGEGVL